MYKDKDKQREAVKQATRRYRDKGASVIPCDSDTLKHMMPSDTPIVLACEVEPSNNKAPRRGKAITCFAHLPPDVQATINRLTTNQDGTVDEQARANRTAIAIDYQHTHPDRYYSTGV